MKHITSLLIGLSIVLGAFAGLQSIRADEAGGVAFFNDVEQGAYYNAPAASMAQKGIVKGYDDGRFAPNDPVTRGQVVTMLHRYDQTVVNPLRKQIAKLRDMMDLGKCGDGKVQVGEQCDDGNMVTGDGCSAECLKEWKPKPPKKKTCEGGYKIGESFPAPDGCNTCFCGEGGMIGCTEMACVEPHSQVLCEEKEQDLSDLIRSKRACRTDDDCSVLVRGCSPFLTCGKPVNTASLGDVKIAIADYIKACPEEDPQVCALCMQRDAICEQGFCKLDEPDYPECGNDVCEKGEASDPGGCGPDTDPLCLGPPAHVGSCPQDCVVPEKNCATFRRGAEIEEHCAICGDGRCDTFEHCVPSNCSSEACTDDCGPLYCVEDCETVSSCDDDVHVCPDGSVVLRNWSNGCAFAPCSEESHITCRSDAECPEGSLKYECYSDGTGASPYISSYSCEQGECVEARGGSKAPELTCEDGCNTCL